MTPLDQVRKPIYTIAFDEEAKGARPPLCLLEQSAKNLNGVVSPTLDRIPADAVGLMICCEPSIAKDLYRTNKALKGSVEDIYLKYSLWDKVKNLPNLSVIVKGDPFFSLEAKSVCEKMDRLVSIARATNRSRSNQLRALSLTKEGAFRSLNDLVSFEGILNFALFTKNEELAKYFLGQFGVECLTQEETYQALKIAVEQDISFPIIDALLSHLRNEIHLSDFFLFLYDVKPTLVESFLQRKLFKMDEALCLATERGKLNLIRLILGSKNPYSRSFYPYAGLNTRDNEEQGLQRAIMIAVDAGKTKALEALISAGPSLEILEHAKKWAVLCHLLKQAHDLLPNDELDGWRHLTEENYYRKHPYNALLEPLYAQVPEPFRNSGFFTSKTAVNPTSHQNHASVQELLDRAIAKRFQDDDVKETPPPLVDEEIPQEVLAVDGRNLQRREGIDVRVINLADDVHDVAYRNRVLAVSTAVLLLALIWQFSYPWSAE